MPGWVKVRARTATVVAAVLVVMTSTVAGAAAGPAGSAGTGRTSTAGAVASAAPAPSEHTARYVTAVYQDLFGRDPDPAGLASWSRALETGTPRVAVANGITYSREFRAGLITDAYDWYLGRGPDPAGLEAWLVAMGQGLTIAQIESGFIASDEYFARSGGTFAGWVRSLYLDVLDREPAWAEVRSWTAALDAGASRQRVAVGFLLSWEHLSTVVDGYYQHLLGRSLDPQGQYAWVSALQSGGRDEAIIGGIVASDEYWGRVAPVPQAIALDAPETAVAGETVEVAVYTLDASGRGLDDVTAASAISLGGAACPGGLCTATTAGTQQITAQYGGLGTSSALVVSVGPPTRLALLLPPVVTAGVATPYSVRAYDAGGNDLGDVTSRAIVSDGFLEAPCSAGQCRFRMAGDLQVHVQLPSPETVATMTVVRTSFPAAPAGHSVYSTPGAGPAVIASTTISAGRTWSMAVPGRARTVALRTDGTVWEWGNYDGCPVGIGTSPTLRPGTGWAWVGADDHHTIALKTDGTLWGWGDNVEHALGSAPACGIEPVEIGKGWSWLSATTGHQASYAIRADGTLWGWGGSTQWGIGSGTPGTVLDATQIGTDLWTAISYDRYALGLRRDGTLWWWGDTPAGGSLVPVQIGTDDDWVSIDAGGSAGAAIKADGSLWMWGAPSTVLGTTDPSGPVRPPTQVGAERRWRAVSIGWRAEAIAEDGTLWAWGRTDPYPHENAPDLLVPTLIDPRTDWTAVSVGNLRSVAVR